MTRQLRLLYLGDGASGGATCLDEELPLDGAEYKAMLDATEAEVVSTWKQIVALIEAGDPTAFAHCSRPFCLCHDLRHLVFPEVMAGGADSSHIPSPVTETSQMMAR